MRCFEEKIYVLKRVYLQLCLFEHAQALLAELLHNLALWFLSSPHRRLLKFCSCLDISRGTPALSRSLTNGISGSTLRSNCQGSVCRYGDCPLCLLRQRRYPNPLFAAYYLLLSHCVGNACPTVSSDVARYSYVPKLAESLTLEAQAGRNNQPNSQLKQTKSA